MLRLVARAGCGLLIPVLLLLLGSTPVAGAPSCNAKSHTASLSGGGVTPGTGTTSTTFRFSVTYTDNSGCTPLVRLSVVGAGTFAMHLGKGSTYIADVVLPAGSYRYSFSAESGSGPGYLVVSLSKVSPSQVVVLAPTPSPTATPTATPPPTPKPTAAPTVAPPPPASATAAVTPVVTPTPPATARATATAGQTPAVTATGTATGTAAPTASASAAPSNRRTPRPTSTPAAAGVVPDDAGSGRGPQPWLLAWTLGTAGGVILFFLLARRWTGAEAAAEPPAAPMTPAAAAEPPAPAVRQRELLADGEERLPRWLRPSVQAARYGSGERRERR